ncbi:MAG: copper amine oxidase N-terminal domain-containing protein [Defluviitaleaceae bacterium]|nr:copper amine oxidase N-terminal domain-containing protein [Defluviitaleaceae bacterium]
MRIKKVIFTFLAIVVCFISPFTARAANETAIAVYVDNNPVDFDTPPVIINNRVMVPLRAIAEAAGMAVGYDSNTYTVTVTKTEKLMQIPLNSANPYIDGKTHVVKLTIGSDTATVDNVKMHLDVPAQIMDNRTFVPIRFISDAMDMDVSWMPKDLTPGQSVIMVSSRLRGSAPLAGELIFPNMSPKTISIVDNDGNIVSLGMDVTEMQKILGPPTLIWGRGVPAPQIRYDYIDNLGLTNTDNTGNAIAEVGCSLGKVTVINLYSDSADKLKTAAGVAVGQKVTDIEKAYGVSEEYLNQFTSKYSTENGKMVRLLYVKGNLFQPSGNTADITHEIDFIIIDGIIDTISINDNTTLTQLSSGQS